jgi:hypothetical protein
VASGIKNKELFYFHGKNFRGKKVAWKRNVSISIFIDAHHGVIDRFIIQSFVGISSHKIF